MMDFPRTGQSIELEGRSHMAEEICVRKYTSRTGFKGAKTEKQHLHPWAVSPTHLMGMNYGQSFFNPLSIIDILM